MLYSGLEYEERMAWLCESNYRPADLVYIGVFNTRVIYADLSRTKRTLVDRVLTMSIRITRCTYAVYKRINAFVSTPVVSRCTKIGCYRRPIVSVFCAP